MRHFPCTLTSRRLPCTLTSRRLPCTLTSLLIRIRARAPFGQTRCTLTSRRLPCMLTSRRLPCTLTSPFISYASFPRPLSCSLTSRQLPPITRHFCLAHFGRTRCTLTSLVPEPTITNQATRILRETSSNPGPKPDQPDRQPTGTTGKNKLTLGRFRGVHTHSPCKKSITNTLKGCR
ncbi:hypothetical protein DPMN_122643 [Dreissena polymorpha]|uniref:Uncharacterized protein n=1 Tax=Dreissena polymorpha TaxID=45954 RepID=A0A9D4JS70_DREPO|nr:hypothetical protein DPMN_122643 [Dreissena polymorpha]